MWYWLLLPGVPQLALANWIICTGRKNNREVEVKIFNDFHIERVERDSWWASKDRCFRAASYAVVMSYECMRLHCKTQKENLRVKVKVWSVQRDCHMWVTYNLRNSIKVINCIVSCSRSQAQDHTRSSATIFHSQAFMLQSNWICRQMISELEPSTTVIDFSVRATRLGSCKKKLNSCVRFIEHIPWTQREFFGARARKAQHSPCGEFTTFFFRPITIFFM